MEVNSVCYSIGKLWDEWFSISSFYNLMLFLIKKVPCQLNINMVKIRAGRSATKLKWNHTKFIICLKYNYITIIDLTFHSNWLT